MARATGFQVTADELAGPVYRYRSGLSYYLVAAAVVVLMAIAERAARLSLEQRKERSGTGTVPVSQHHLGAAVGEVDPMLPTWVGASRPRTRSS